MPEDTKSDIRMFEVRDFKREGLVDCPRTLILFSRACCSWRSLIAYRWECVLNSDHGRSWVSSSYRKGVQTTLTTWFSHLFLSLELFLSLSSLLSFLFPIHSVHSWTTCRILWRRKRTRWYYEHSSSHPMPQTNWPGKQIPSSVCHQGLSSSNRDWELSPKSSEGIYIWNMECIEVFSCIIYEYFLWFVLLMSFNSTISKE